MLTTPRRVAKRHLALAALATATLALTACAPTDEADSGTDASESSSPSTSESAAADECTPDTMQTVADGTLTIATDDPAYEPWFVDNDPTNGEGYESAVAYAVAEQLGYTQDQVTWVKVPFNKVVQPGPKDFDFDVNQVSITEARRKAVDFSSGYYDVVQTVITTSVVTGVQLREDMDKGVFDRFRSLPIARVAPLAGALLADTVRYGIATVLTFVAGYLMGYRPEAGLGGVLAAGLVVVVAAWSLSWTISIRFSLFLGSLMPMRHFSPRQLRPPA